MDTTYLTPIWHLSDTGGSAAGLPGCHMTGKGQKGRKGFVPGLM